MRPVFRDINDPLKEIISARRHALIVGLGHSGVSAANLLKNAGCTVEVSEKAPREHFSGPLTDLHPDIRIHWGEHKAKLFREFPLIVVSPGVPAGIKALREAERSGAIIIGEMELAYRLSDVPWVAITGSNGKSTTTTLIGEFAREAGINAAVGGNLGTPVTEFTGGESSVSWIIAEVSSFQLETIDRFHPSIGALLNISPDHLDRYLTMDEYTRAKSMIFSRMSGDDWAILNEDDGEVKDIAADIEARKLMFSRKKRLALGVLVSEGWITLRDDKEEEKVIKARDVALTGTHNLENALAAAAIGWKMGIKAEAMAAALSSFQGLEHRMELVEYYRGVPVYNDSKGTNVGATKQSLEGLGRDVILIMGGRDKGASYEPLRKAVRSKVRLLILMGEASERIENVLGSESEILKVEGINGAVRAALDNARPGSEILFSPACSSFDMFKSFEERGRAFKNTTRHYMGMS